MFKPFILCNIIFIHFIVAVDVGDECVPNNKVSDGICTMLANCEVAIKEIKERKKHEFVRCGFKGINEVVCCPQATSKFGSQSLRVAERECKKITEASLPPLDLHIIGGEVASIGEFPHMVALGFQRASVLSFDCGGTLLSNTYILTAAHCVDTIDKIAPSVVRAGVVQLGSEQWDDSTDYKIDEIILYPEYKRREKYHDIALLRLRKAIPFSSNVNAVCLYTSSEDPKVPLTITGWGQTSTTSSNSRSSVLLKATVSVVPRERCNLSYTNWRKLPQGISNEQLCAGDSEGEYDTCQGDSGGPLQGITEGDGYYRLIGITSFGRGCGSSVPGVYTRVALYLDWIESVVWG